MPLPLVLALNATTFHRPMGSGRTKPCLIGCENADGTPAGDFVVKFAGTIESGPVALASEMISSRLASALGIPVPLPAVVNVEEDFVETIEDPFFKARLRRCLGLNFGSMHFGGGFTVWPRNQTITPLQFQTASEIFAFDVLINNADRKHDTPNLLFRSEELYAIDHELAFSFMSDMFPPPQVEDFCTPERLDFLKRHIFYQHLRTKPLNYARLEGAAAGVDKDTIKQIESDVPTPWQTGQFGRILPYIEAVLARPRQFTQIAREILAI